MVRSRRPAEQDDSHVRIARFWEPLEDKPGYVQCDLCHRRCIVKEGRWGVCGVRKNVGGRMYTYVYGLLTAAAVDPIEKKPLMHFHPGSETLSVSTVGCNFFCKFCQNWELSQSRLEQGLYGEYVDPERLVEHALQVGADGVTFTYNEPTIFYEYMYDVARLAKQRGLYTTMVTNGYMTPEAVRELGPYMDAATVDFKGAGDKRFYRSVMGVWDPEPIYDTLIEMKKMGWFLEVTNLVVPRIGDSPEALRKLARWVHDNLGPETPFHLLRFHPHYKLRNLPPTPVETLEKLARIAEEEGLKHVYLGNVWGHPKEHTYCPRCGYRVIERYGFYITEWRLGPGNTCPRCGYKLNIRGEFKGVRRPRFRIL